MKITKSAFTKIMSKWLVKYLTAMYSEKYSIEVIIPKSTLAKLSSRKIKTIPDFSSFEFKPDILGILKNKENGKAELVFMNRSINAISLKEIGEMLCYCRLANPKDAFICSPKGAPTEVILLLHEDSIQTRLLNYSGCRFITLFKYDTQNDKVDEKFLFPKSKKDLPNISEGVLEKEIPG